MTKPLRTLALGTLLAVSITGTHACATDDTSDDATTGGSAGAGAAGKSGSAGKPGSSGGSGKPGAGGSSVGTGGTAGESGAPDVGGTGGSSGGGGDAASAGQPGAAGEPSSGGTGGTSGTGTGGTGASACNDASYDDAPTVHPVMAEGGPGTLPPPRTGGKIVDGTYFLTKYEVYGIDAPPGTYQVAMVITGSDLELAQTKDGSETRASFVLTLTDTKFAAASTCPVVGQSLAYDTYSASSTELVLFDDERVVTLTLQ